MKLKALRPRIQRLAPRIASLPAPSQASGYRIRGRRLQAIRAEHLRRNPLCVLCQDRGVVRAATEVDHILALSRGGRDEPENRQGLCTECHQAKTASDLGHTRKAGCAADGMPDDPAHPWNAIGRL